MTEHGQAVATTPSDRQVGVRIDVQALTRTVRAKERRELTLLDAASFSVAPGELVAIVGGSGAGKTTLLEAMAGVTPATAGCVRFDGADLYANLRTFRTVLGFVPQDDIIHVDLPLDHTLRYAARLRLPPSTTARDVDAAVGDGMAAVDLTSYADTRVASLSGGQRKRASIAVELLTSPQVFFLAGAVISLGIPSRWAFEAVGHDLGARRILADGGSPLGRPLLASYGDAGTSSIGLYWAILVAFAVIFLIGTWIVLVRTTRHATR